MKYMLRISILVNILQNKTDYCEEIKSDGGSKADDVMLKPEDMEVDKECEFLPQFNKFAKILLIVLKNIQLLKKTSEFPF